MSDPRILGYFFAAGGPARPLLWPEELVRATDLETALLRVLATSPVQRSVRERGRERLPALTIPSCLAKGLAEQTSDARIEVTNFAELGYVSTQT